MNYRLAWYCALGLIAAAVAVIESRASEPLSLDRQREILRDGLNSFDQAVAAARGDAPRAQQLYRQAAAAFEGLLESGVQSPGLEYNLGNTYFRLNELDRSILHYRRADRLGGRDRNLASNLEYARSRVQPLIAPSAESKLARRLMFWHFDTSARGRFLAAALLSIAGWGLLLARLRWRSTALGVVGVCAALAGLSAGGSLLWQLNDDARRPPAVVMHGEQTLRLGRGEGYEPAMKEPLGPGVEIRVINQRGDWVEVCLENDVTGWLPAAAVERV